MPNVARVTIFITFVHLALGAILPYLPVWLGVTKGLSGVQIGIILASPSFGSIVVGPLTAAWAEGCKDRRTPIIVLSLLALVGHALLYVLGRDRPKPHLALRPRAGDSVRRLCHFEPWSRGSPTSIWC